MKLTIKTQADLHAERITSASDRIMTAIDTHIEGQAHALRYKSAAHLASYASSEVASWRDEALAFVAWRDAVWLSAYAHLARSQKRGAVPALHRVLAALPKLTPPG
jgi:hypothetical protein